MQIGHIELFALDPARTADFYLDVLGFQPVVQQPGNRHWIALESQELLIRPASAGMTAPDRYDQSSIALVIYTEKLDATVERLQAAGAEMSRAEGASKGFMLRDPDGRWIQLIDPSTR